MANTFFQNKIPKMLSEIVSRKNLFVSSTAEVTPVMIFSSHSIAVLLRLFRPAMVFLSFIWLVKSGVGRLTKRHLGERMAFSGGGRLAGRGVSAGDTPPSQKCM